MAPAFDLVVRGGAVCDGDGGQMCDVDVGLKGGAIAAVGRGLPRGRDEIDARGLLVTPGFVDIHTHYDGQATWDSFLEPSSSHGVTTAVLGNCGVGFAPCRPADRGALIRLMEGVEDIPGTALAEGLAWNWSSFPEYLDALDSRPHDMDLAAYVPHGALRVYAMGQRGIDRLPATDADIEVMAGELDAALGAGAIGLATSRSIAHRTADGDPTPMFNASARELVGLSSQLAGRGIFQMVSDFFEEEDEFELLKQMVAGGALAASFSLAQTDNTPSKWRSLLDRAEAADTEGWPIRPQSLCRPIGVLMGLQASVNPFSYRPSFKAIAHLPPHERARRMADPTLKARILAEADEGAHQFLTYYSGSLDKLFPFSDPPNYAPKSDTSFAALARRQGCDPIDLIYDYMTGSEGLNLIYLPMANYSDGNLEVVRQIMQHPLTLPGLGDGGAHVGVICDASYSTYLLKHWAIDENAISLGKAVSMLTRESAELVGLADRGRIVPGYRADLNLINPDELRLRRPHVVRDLPAGGGRFMQAAEGYAATIVAGTVTRRLGEATGALPGRLIRGRRKAPALARKAPS